MSDNPVLLAEERTEFGTGAARRARRAAKLTGASNLSHGLWMPHRLTRIRLDADNEFSFK